MASTTTAASSAVAAPRLSVSSGVKTGPKNSRVQLPSSAFHGKSVCSSRQLESVAALRAAGDVLRRGGARRAVVVCKAAPEKTVVIGLAADSGCGKSTFMRRLTSVFGGAAHPPKGGNPDSNTLISDTTTVICLDDYHSLDRYGRKEKAVTALDPRANNFDLMYEQVKALKEGKAVEKPIYNHVSGLLDAPETIQPPKILVIEGLHPM